MQNQVKQNLKVVNYTGIVAVTLLLAGTLAFAVYPMVKDGKEDIKVAVDKREAMQRAEALRPDIKAARNAQQASELRLQEAEKRLPMGPPDNEFSKELNEVAKAAGFRVESMPPMGTPKSDGAYKSVQVSVVGNGDWESCYRFLKGIGSMNRISRLDSVVMEAKDGQAPTAQKPICQITVKFSTYYLEH